MSDTVIKIENLWKEYRLGTISHHSMAMDLQSWWARLRGKEDPNAPLGSVGKSVGDSGSDRFWALHDVSFEVKRGDLVGIIGRNGAGKSTLLKILSKVTTPTRGQVTYRGRIASLLEVGTGFHPELTGRENIFLNGAILGMGKEEIRRKFDEIVDFAEVEKFIDTPVKRYSSGMYVRLAFGVAAHLEPEILIVDEVLAVGDAQFQKKCLGKMGEVGKEGRTVLFVSHNMAAISALCKKIIVLDSGSVWMRGGLDAIPSYLNYQLIDDNIFNRRNAEGIKSKQLTITNLSFTDCMGNDVINALSGNELSVCLDFVTTEPVIRPDFAFTIYDINGLPIAYFDTAYSFNGVFSVISNISPVICVIPKLPIVEGTYTINVLAYQGDQYFDHIVGAAKLTVVGGDFYGTGKLPPSNYAPILVDHHWTSGK